MTTEMGFQTEIVIILRENASQVIYEMHRAIVEILTRSGPSAARWHANWPMPEEKNSRVKNRSKIDFIE